MNISESLLKLIQETNDVTLNPLLLQIDLDFIKELEKESKTDLNIAGIISEMQSSIEGANIQDLGRLSSIYTRYGEAKFYKALKSRIAISRVRREKGKQTPDFEIKFDGKKFYAEAKSFLMTGGDSKYNAIMKDAMDIKINAQNQAKTGKRVVISEQVVNPHLKNERDYDSRSIGIVIENLIAKFNQDYKDGQYDMGDTISLIYLGGYNFPLYGGKIVPFYIDYNSKALLSGELWTAVFGKKGMPVFKYPDFEGAKSRDGDLKYDGILVNYSKPKAVCFYIEGLNHQGNIVALIRFGEEDEIRCLISKITDLYNDDQNSRFFQLIS